MSMPLNRQQRRQMPKNFKENVPRSVIQKDTPVKESYAISEQFTAVVRDIQTVYTHSKSVNSNVWFIMDTLARKGIITWEDYRDTENLYKQREEKKQIKVKELLAQDLSIPEILTAITEPPNLLGYEKLGLHPIKDLNVNPNELAYYIRTTVPGKTPEEYLELGRKWQLTDVHFGFRKPDEAII